MTEEKSFEEMFPNLWGMACDTRLNARRESKRVFDQDTIQEYCLSKQRVTEAIDKYMPLLFSGQKWINKEKLKKELGLE